MSKLDMIEGLVRGLHYFADKIESGQIDVDNCSISGVDCETGLVTMAIQYKERCNDINPV